MRAVEPRSAKRACLGLQQQQQEELVHGELRTPRSVGRPRSRLHDAYGRAAGPGWSYAKQEGPAGSAAGPAGRVLRVLGFGV